MDYTNYIRYILALIFVLALIAVIAAVARRFGLGYRVAGRPGRSRRLAIVEVMPVDAKRRLVLFRRDSTEHLVLLGGTGPDLLVETGIAAPPDDFADALDAARSTTSPGATK